MSAETRTGVVTRITCDQPGCKVAQDMFGTDKETRAALNQKSPWRCDGVARVDMCPDHAAPVVTQ